MTSWPDLNIQSLTPEAARLAETLTVSPILAQLLHNRGIDAAEARLMLTEKPELSWPEPDFTPALRERFQQLASEQAAVAIFGDYDADGLSGTAVLSVFLRGAGLTVTPKLPTRSQGYGLNRDSISALADSGHKLLITVDCGISNAEEIQFARSLGMAVVITDHHGLPEILPEADFILHPAVLGIPELTNLSGAGMAWWLSALLHPAFTGSPPPESLLDLAVLGTLADMTPLRGLNFSLAKRGLQAARLTKRPGLLALARLKSIDLSQLTEDDLTFRMIPMLNAAGRIDSPQPALDLLLSEDPTETRVLANELLALNGRRQLLCQEVLADTLSLLRDNNDRTTIVLADAGWLHGVLGITCSQLVERFHKPVVLLAIEGEHAKASVRCPKGYNVLEALQSCADLLVRFGGHEMAGGFTVETVNIPAFSDRFDQACLNQQTGVVKRLNVEMELNPHVLSLDLLRDIRRLAPFGMGNPAPVFLSLNVGLDDIKSDRKSQTHFFAKLQTGLRLKGWQMWNEAWATETRFDLVYGLEQAVWREHVQLELTLHALRPHEPIGSRPQPVQAADPAQPAATDLSAAPSTTQSEPQPPETAPVPAIPAGPQDPPHPGWFYDGENYWTLPITAVTAEPVWEDRRRGEIPVPSSDSVLYVQDHPPDAQLLTGQAGQFSTLLLDQPPAPEVWPALGQSFKHVLLLPLKPLNEPPSFQALWPILAFLQEQDLALTSANELASRFSLAYGQAELCLKSLCDLGLLAYDKERYRIQYKNQLYDLRQSATFRGARQRWQEQQETAKLWQSVSLDHLKAGLWSQKGKQS